MDSFYQSKRIGITVLLILISIAAFAQNFSPFNETVTKRFFNPANPKDNKYFFYADSTHNPSPGKTIFHQYYTLQVPTGNVSTSGCGFWGGGVKYVTDTTWLGVDIVYDSIAKHLTLKNIDGDTLNFDFSIQAGDSAIFFQNSTDKYFIKAGQTQNETIYSVTDAVRTFTILHYGSNNQVVNSPLHEKEIKLGQQTGLIKFIGTYNFPAVEKYLVLQGQLNPLIGNYQMRFEDLYPFHVGDSLQYQGHPSQPPCGYIINYRVLARNETADSVKIEFGSSINYVSSAVPSFACASQQVYPNFLKFPKNSDLLGYPYDRLVGQSGGCEIRMEDSINTICSKRLHFQGEAIPAAYCASCKCLGPTDSQGMPYPKVDYAKGAGVITRQTTEFGPNQKNNFVALTYAAIGGKVCGSYVKVGLPKYELSGFSIYPSPASEELTISIAVDRLTIYSADGTDIQTILQPKSTINIGHLPPGIYILQLRKGENIGYSKIVKQ